MTINDCKTLFITYVMSYASTETVTYYEDNMGFFRRYLESQHKSFDDDINSLAKTDYIGYMAYHKKRGVKNTSVRTYARAIKVFFRYCYNEGYMLENITLNVKFPKSDKRLIVPLTNERVNKLERYIYHTNMKYRDLAIIHLMIDCGLRLSEVIGLDMCHINFADGYITIIDSKNNKSRVVPLPDKVNDMIHEYLVYQRRGKDTALFLNTSCNARITKSVIESLFYRLKKNVDSDLYPHLLRHTFGTSFILGGGSLEILRILMGHEDYNVTKEYLHIANQSQIVCLNIYKLDDVFFRVYNYRRE